MMSSEVILKSPRKPPKPPYPFLASWRHGDNVVLFLGEGDTPHTGYGVSLSGKIGEVSRVFSLENFDPLPPGSTLILTQPDGEGE